VRRKIAPGEVITCDDAELPDSTIVTLRRLQEAWMAGQIQEDALKARLDALAVR